MILLGIGKRNMPYKIHKFYFILIYPTIRKSISFSSGRPNGTVWRRSSLLTPRLHPLRLSTSTHFTFWLKGIIVFLFLHFFLSNIACQPQLIVLAAIERFFLYVLYTWFIFPVFFCCFILISRSKHFLLKWYTNLYWYIIHLPSH